MTIDSSKAGWLRLAALAAVMGAGTWALSTLLFPVQLPDDFPKLPDLAALNPDLQKLLTGADKEARRHPGSAEVVGKLGMAYHANQFLDQAASAYRIAARLAPSDYQWAYCQAYLQEENGNEKEEFEALQRTLQLKPDHIPALLKLADADFKRDRLDQAAHEYELAAGNPDRDYLLQSQFGLARVAARREEWDRVIGIAVPLTQNYPTVRPPFQSLQKAYEALGKIDKAAEVREAILSGKFTDVPPPKDALHDRLIELCYSSTRLLKEAGLLSRFGYPDRGIQMARRAAQADPKDPDPHNLIARTLMSFYPDKPEAIDEALTELGEYLRRKPDDVAALWGFTTSFFETPRPAAAIERLRALVRPYANRDDAHFYLGLIADASGRKQEAFDQYQAALKVDPNSARTYNKLGLMFADAGKPDAALAYLQKSVQLDPMNPVARLNLGIALMQRENYAQGLKELAEVLRLDPHDAAAHFCMGFGYLYSNRPDQAAAKFRDGLRYKPEDPEAHFGLGSALSMQRKRDDAVAELRQALRLRPNYPEAQDLLQRLDR